VNGPVHGFDDGLTTGLRSLYAMGMATKANPTEKKALWLGFARDATNRYVIPEDIDDADELIEDMVDVATGYADAMLEELEERFSGGAARRRRGKRKDEEEEEEEEEDSD
jgi:ATP-dependent DNA ligase